MPRVLFTKVREVKDNEKNGPGANFLSFFLFRRLQLHKPFMTWVKSELFLFQGLTRPK